MPIREKVRRALRRSAVAAPTSPTPSTSDSGSASGSGGSSPPAGGGSRLSARLANLSFGGRRGRGLSSADKAGARRGESPDPRQKPLTQANMRYQELFGEYTMTFGASRRLSRDCEAEGVSPMTSRRNSFCWGET